MGPNKFVYIEIPVIWVGLIIVNLVIDNEHLIIDPYISNHIHCRGRAAQPDIYLQL